MKASYEDQSMDMLQRDIFQGSLDFFYGRYLYFFPTGELKSISEVENGTQTIQ